MVLKGSKRHVASTPNETAGVPVSKFVMHFANGETRTLEMRLGDDVWNLTVPAKAPQAGEEFARGLDRAEQSKNPDGDLTQIFLTTWENPFPDIVVGNIDFISALNEPTPYLYAIMAEP